LRGARDITETKQDAGKVAVNLCHESMTRYSLFVVSGRFPGNMPSVDLPTSSAEIINQRTTFFLDVRFLRGQMWL